MMVKTPREVRNTEDPLSDAAEKLEDFRKELAADGVGRGIELERFKEETLWRLNALSDRTIEIARLEDEKTTLRLEEDLVRINGLIGQWEALFAERLHDEKFINAMAEDALTRLLPTGGETPDPADDPRLHMGRA